VIDTLSAMLPFGGFCLLCWAVERLKGGTK
jgi:hypothetical protein